jgi:ABC-type anion transport system duplicated permease subunit
VRVVTVIAISALLGFAVGWFVGRPSRAERKRKD